MKILNAQGEKLDVLIEGDGDTTVVFVHGFGSGKNEGMNLFVDISNALPEYRRVRFDFSGYGESEGKQEDGCLDKFAQDLNAVLQEVRNSYGGKTYIIAHSMGTFATSLLSPEGIEKTIFTSMPHPNTENGIAGTKRRIMSRGGTVHEEGITEYPRASGTVQLLGPAFWKGQRAFTPDIVGRYASKTQLTIIKPLEDEVVAPYDHNAYGTASATYIMLHGDHNFSKERRDPLIMAIRTSFGLNPHL